LALLREVGDTDGIAALLGNLGYGAFMEHDYARSVARSEESLALYRALKSDYGMASMLGNLGRAVLEQGDAGRAGQLLQEGLALGHQIGNKWYIAVCLEGLAATAGVQGRSEQAVRLFGALASLTETGDVVLPAADQEINERYLAAARTSLNGAAFASAWEDGRAMSTDQAIAEALAEVGTSETTDSLPALPDLTKRENAVLRLLAQGRTDRQIAEALAISHRTASGHVASILAKLGLESRTAAAAYAVRHGLA
jgi:non-specific serine/threonine protein kinase